MYSLVMIKFQKIIKFVQKFKIFTNLTVIKLLQFNQNPSHSISKNKFLVFNQSAEMNTIT